MANYITQLKIKLRGRTQASLAQEIGVSPPHLCEVLAGRKPPGTKIRKFLGVEKQVTYRRNDRGT